MTKWVECESNLIDLHSYCKIALRVVYGSSSIKYSIDFSTQSGTTHSIMFNDRDNANTEYNKLVKLLVQ